MPSPLPPNSYYVISYPRSGNTWLINCLTLLLDGVRGEAYTPFKLYTELHGTPGPDFHFWCEPRQRPDQPVCIKSHDAWPAFQARHPSAPVVYIARDGRDSLLSYYFFQQAYAQGEQLETQRIAGTGVLISRGTKEPAFDPAGFAQFLRTEAPAWAAHVRSGRAAAGELCYLTYEDLMQDFEATLARVIAHLELPLARTYAEARQVYHAGFGSVFSGNNRDFFRRGKIGDWKNWFQPEHARLLDELIGRDLRELGFESDPAWARHYVAPPAPTTP